MKLSKMKDGSPEIYSAVQGEGPSIQKPCVFVRFAMCNLSCNFCDTAYTWNFKGDNRIATYTKPFKKEEVILEMTAEEVALEIREKAGTIRRVVFTGGEPLLQQDDMYKVIELLQEGGEEWYIEIETNGTLFIKDSILIDQINCSPKLASSGNGSMRHNPLVINSYIKHHSEDGIELCFKFVVGTSTHKEDLEEIKAWEKEISCSKSLIYLMPEGITTYSVTEGTKFLIDICKEQGYNLSTRLHVLLYGNQKAV